MKNHEISWKIDTIDLTQQFSLSISTDFRYQSIIDTDQFYRLTTPALVSIQSSVRLIEVFNNRN